MHNASTFPPLGEGYVQTREASLPLSYFRSYPMGSPIMNLYQSIVNTDVINNIRRLHNFDKEGMLLPPLNLYMFDLIKSMIKDNKRVKTNIEKVKILGSNSESIFIIEKKESEQKIWENTFELITSTGISQNGFEVILSGLQTFLKYSENKNNKTNFSSNTYEMDNAIHKIFATLSKIKILPEKYKVNDLYDRTLEYRSKTCNLIIELIKDHQFKYLKPFHVKHSQNLIIQILAPPNSKINKYKTNSDNIEHTMGWVGLVQGFFGGLLNHYADQENKYIYTTIRDSYGFLRPTLTATSTSIRLSMGLQPSCYANIVANALITLDETLDKFKNIYIISENDDELVTLFLKWLFLIPFLFLQITTSFN